MIANVLEIDNSISISLDKSLVKKYNFNQQVNVILLDDGILIKNNQSRKGWGKEFEIMHQNGEDSLFIDDIFIDDIKL